MEYAEDAPIAISANFCLSALSKFGRKWGQVVNPLDQEQNWCL